MLNISKSSSTDCLANCKSVHGKSVAVRCMPLLLLLLFMIIVFRFINLLRALFGMRSTQNSSVESLWAPWGGPGSDADN